MDRVEKGEIDPSFVITHRLDLTQGAAGYATFDGHDGCIKVVLRP
jgi:threonine dehydrogenase-like Zn-dependent dehydrogenase